MKTLKTLTCAIAAAAALTFCAPSAEAVTGIGIVTNYNVLTFNITVSTNIYKATSSGYTYTVNKTKLVNKDVLAILQGPDFYNGTFPAGAKLVLGWDAPWDGDVLVVDKTGTNVLYNGDSGGTTHEAYLYMDFFYEYGTWSENYNGNDPGHDNLTEYNSGEFDFYDETSTETEKNLYLWTEYSPAQMSYNQNWDKNDVDTTWSSTASMILSGGDQGFGGSSSYESTLGGTFTSSGNGKGLPYYIWDND